MPHCFLMSMGTPFLGVDTRSVETTISMGQNMHRCHSLRCKQIDMSTADDLKSISLDNAGGTCTCNRVKTGWKTEGVIIIECEVSFTPRDGYLSILQAHAGQTVSLLQMNRTSETLSEPESTHISKKYESNVGSDKTTGNISSKTDQSKHSWGKAKRNAVRRLVGW